ncbi:MAG TPA: class I SAM-dependent methyltransferase [Streptosporangiaceae bacterium]
MAHDHDAEDFANHFTQEFWDDRYGSAEQIWSGQPNAQLVAQAGELTPGEALDVGCGEGADVIWLASRGWAVTGVDVSPVALERAAKHAAAQGGQVAGRITWRQEDLLTWAPEPERFDLVTAAYMHLPGGAFESFQRGLAAAVRPGGTLLMMTHHPDDLHANVGRTGHPGMFPSAEDLAAALDPSAWKIAVASAFPRPATDVDGQPTQVRDVVLRAVRH